MPDARQISRLQAAQGRDRYLSRSIDRTETFDAADRPAVYRGYDANSGLHRTERMGHEPTLGATSLTNGGLSNGDAVTQTEGDRSFDAMPQGRRRRRRRRHITSTETLISALFVGSRSEHYPSYSEDGSLGTDKNSRSLLIWLKDSNKPGCDHFEIPLKIYRGSIGPRASFGEQSFFFYLSETEKIVQIDTYETSALGVSGELAAKTIRHDQSDRDPRRDKYYNFFTIHFRNNQIAKIELTASGIYGNLTYSDYWTPYLPCLWRSKEFNQKLLGDDPTKPDNRLTISPIGHFRLEKPLPNFRQLHSLLYILGYLDDPNLFTTTDAAFDLKNFFGSDPPLYLLDPGGSARLGFSLDDLGFTEEEKAYGVPHVKIPGVRYPSFVESLQIGFPFIRSGNPKFPDRIFSDYAVGFRGGDTIYSRTVTIRCAAIRGIVT